MPAGFTVTSIASKFDAGLVAMLAAALVLAAVLAAPVVIQDGDLYWQIAAGRWMIDNQAVLRIDPFSATFTGHPWQALAWLADIALALAYVGAGWSGMLAATAVAAALSAALLAYFLSRQVSGLVLPVTLTLSLAVGAPALTASPMILALPLFIIWCAGLARARAERRGPSHLLIIAMVLWANTDSSYLAGLALTAIMGLEAVIESPSDRLAVARDWALFAGLALIASVFTPYGIAGFSVAVSQVQLPQTGSVRTVLSLILAVPATALLVQGRVISLRLLFLGPLFVLSLYGKADQLLLAVALPVLLADTAAAVLHQKGLNPRIPLKPVLTLVALAVVALGMRLLIVVERGDDAMTPQTALEHVPASLLHSPVFNNADFGGFLIFREVRPFIDGRLLYSPAFRARYTKLMRGDAVLLATTLDRRHIRWTLLAPNDPVVAVMNHLGNWQRLYADRWAVVYARKDVL